MNLAGLNAPVKVPTIQPIGAARKIRNTIATMLCAAAFLIAMVPLVWVLYTVAQRGFSALTAAEWWSRSLTGVLPEEYAGGVFHAIYGTLMQAGIAALLALPLGISAAVYLVEYGRGRFARSTKFMVDILAGVPSIVAALFVFSLWIAVMGFRQSAFAVSLALALLMLPALVRNTEEMLNRVPDGVRQASLALGIPKWKTVARIVVPTAFPGIISGMLLASARVMGETAPVLVLVGYARSVNYNPFQGNMASLPLLIYTEWNNPQDAAQLRMWGAALTLVLIVTAFYLAAALVTRLPTRNRP